MGSPIPGRNKWSPSHFKCPHAFQLFTHGDLVTWDRSCRREFSIPKALEGALHIHLHFLLPPLSPSYPDKRGTIPPLTDFLLALTQSQKLCSPTTSHSVGILAHCPLLTMAPPNGQPRCVSTVVVPSAQRWPCIVDFKLFLCHVERTQSRRKSQAVLLIGNLRA